eukprot:scaffold624_cov176-Amphora_coffeaeformis.AAC.5
MPCRAVPSHNTLATNDDSSKAWMVLPGWLSTTSGLPLGSISLFLRRFSRKERYFGGSFYRARKISDRNGK